MADTYCSNCKKYTEVVLDYSAGDSVCTECGLVLEACTIDETAEWRNESTNHDPVRVGAPFNPLIGDSLLGTVISNPKGSVTSDFDLLARGSNRNRAVIVGFKTLTVMCDKLGIVNTIKDRAYEMYRKLVEDWRASLRKDKIICILAACLYIACRLEDQPRSFKEICSVANVASINRAMKYVMKRVKVEENRRVRAGDFVGRFCLSLGMTASSVEAAKEVAEKCEKINVRRSPISIAAAVVYIVAQHEKRSLKDVSAKTQVGEYTIKTSYMALYGHLVRIVPSWFAQEEDLKNFKFGYTNAIMWM